MAQAGGGAAAAEEFGEMDLEEEQLLANLGHHPLLERVQTALLRQLRARKDRVEEQLRDHKEDAERHAKAREDLGVELYGVQQRLAKLQVKLEEVTTSADAVSHVRQRAEADLAKFRSGFAQRQGQIAAEGVKVEKLRAELDGIFDALRQAEAYNSEKQGEVAVARRETYKTEQELSDVEKSKREQDMLIDDLNERIKRLGEQLAVREAQIVAQRRDAAIAEETLRDAAREMEAIARDKQELMTQWRSLLVEMGRRDRSLEECEAALREQEGAFLSLNAEEANTARAISRAQDLNSTLQEVREREEAARRFCEASLAALLRQREQLQQRADMLRASLESADAEDARLGVAGEALSRRVRELERELALSEKWRHDAEAGMEETESSQVTSRKAAKNLARSGRQILDLVHQKELERAELENTLARSKVAALEAASRVESLRTQLRSAEEDIADKERLVARYELDIRQRNDAIEKKMTLVDRLNRKYEAVTRDLPEEEHMGPLQATVHNITQQIASARTEAATLQKRWLSEQTQLVEIGMDLEAKAAELRELRSQRALMEQKRVRLDGAAKQLAREASDLRSAMARMREDTERISGLIARNESLRTRLADATFAAETDFVESLKDMEEACARAESEIARAKEEKARLLEDLLETERQAEMWEKKLQLERETQEALDPTVGKSEVIAMGREIHRMKLRLETLRRDQERLVKELEGAVEKREMIGMRKRAAPAGAPAAAAGGTAASAKGPRLGASSGGGAARPDSAGLSKAAVVSRIAALKRQLVERRATAAKYEQTVAAQSDELSRAEAERQDEERAVAELEQEVAEVQAGVNAAVYEKQKAAEAIATARDMTDHLSLAADRVGEAYVSTESDSGARAAVVRLGEQLVQRDLVRSLIGELQASQPALAEVLDRVRQLTDIVP